MTAAHCVVRYEFRSVSSISVGILKFFFLSSKPSNLTTSEIDIVAGTNEWNAHGMHYDVSDIIVHEQYNSTNYINDIALIRLQSSIEFNEKVQSISLSSKEVPPGTKLQTSGWGLLVVLYTFFLR